MLFEIILEKVGRVRLYLNGIQLDPCGDLKKTGADPNDEPHLDSKIILKWK